MKIALRPLRRAAWLLVLAAATLARADTQLELAWSAFDACGACQVGGGFQLDGAAGQPDSGVLETLPWTVWGGFMSPLSPSLQILSPNADTWQVGRPAQIYWKADKAAAGNYVRFELWRNSTKQAVLGTAPVTGSNQYSTVIVPILSPGRLYRLRMVSTRLESFGNPNSWVETDPALTLASTSAIDPRAWAIYE